MIAPRSFQVMVKDGIIIERLESVESTSTWLRTQRSDAPHGTVVVTDCQTAGRGQRGNSWEAAPGMNLTFSVLTRPEPPVPASQQYALSEAVATAIVDTLDSMVPYGERLEIKWPNDIYYENRKLAGILIENSLSGTVVSRSIAGVGINVNQEIFTSDAPNPVSLKQLTGRTYDLESLLENVCLAIVRNIRLIADPAKRNAIGKFYRSKLWHREGLHPYMLPDGTRFNAQILSVASTGHLKLKHDDGSESVHAFKEVIQIVE